MKPFTNLLLSSWSLLSSWVSMLGRLCHLKAWDSTNWTNIEKFPVYRKTLNSRNRDVSWSIFPKPVFFLYQQVETRTMSSSGTSEVMLTTWLWWKDRTRWPWPWPRLGSKPSKTIPSQTFVSKGMWWSLWRLRRTGLKHSSSNPEKICWSPQKNLGNPKSYWDKREPPKV